MVRRFELRIDVSDAVPFAEATLALSLVVPDGPLSGPRVLMFGFPGGGYSRGYWDITWPGIEGYSEADHHVERGWLFAAVDHLGVGDSTQPDPESLTFEVLAAANDAAVRHVVDGLRHGVLVEELGAVDVIRTIGAGQSMGGCLTIVAQGIHGTFDAIAVLGFSAVHTALPTPNGVLEMTPVERGTTDTEAFDTSQVVDVFRWAFHWEDVNPVLLDADMSGGYPLRSGSPPMWGSVSVPPAAMSMLTAGVVAPEAAAVSVPVFVGMGERDVCPDPRGEPAAYRGTGDITLLVVPKMAHMHNFAAPRRVLWNRLHAWGESLCQMPG